MFEKTDRLRSFYQMDKMKVVIIAQRYGIVPPIYGGAVETLLFSLIKYNEKYGKLRMTIIESHDDQAVELSRTLKNTKFVFIKESVFGKALYRIFRKVKDCTWMSGKFFSEYMYRAFQYVKKNIPDVDLIIIEEDFQTQGYEKFKKYFPGKVVYHSHLHEVPRKNIYHDFVISVSEFCRNEWLKFFSEKNTFVLRNAINIELFKRRISQQERVRIREKYGISPQDFVVLFCGRIIPVKGLRELIKAVLTIEDNKVKLLCVGSSGFAQADKNSYLREIQNLVVCHQERIVFTGYIENNDLYKYYQVADVQVVPSLWEEAAGLVTIEGMCSGLPLIVTKSGGMVEYIDEQCAMIVDRKEIVKNLTRAICMAQSDSIWRAKASEVGLKRAEHFSEERYFESFISIVRTITSRG